MKHTILTVLLTLGVVGGTVAGIHRIKDGRGHHRAEFEQHVAEICVAAATRAMEKEQR